MIEVALGLSVAALLFSLVTCVFSILAYSEVIGMRKSTHRVDWMPFEPDEDLSKVEKKEAEKIHQYLNGEDDY